ncbi:hypothetical protein [Oligoflexus sp.]|uniref:hypothetical protein n=1 Tax=Oligoflexus sp. TaxID=1971216 RepID=UPI002D78B6AA|nr:hypothetical protein [Oligoflexus sp.]
MRFALAVESAQGLGAIWPEGITMEGDLGSNGYGTDCATALTRPRSFRMANSLAFAWKQFLSVADQSAYFADVELTQSIVAQAWSRRFSRTSALAVLLDETARVMDESYLESSLEVRRYLKELDQDLGTDKSRLRQLLISCNHELHKRKTFWVDESLVYMLAHTDIDLLGHDLKLPFPSFAFVFTDRYFLSLAERWLAREADCPLRGYILRVATVYVMEKACGEDRVISLAFAFDALGADLPCLVEKQIQVGEAQDLGSRAHQNRVDELDLKASDPLQTLLDLSVNAVLYATSSPDKTEVRAPRSLASLATSTRSELQIASSDTVFFLPGKIKLSLLRQMQELVRAPMGRQIFYRFMVRGHWCGGYH